MAADSPRSSIIVVLVAIVSLLIAAGLAVLFLAKQQQDEARAHVQQIEQEKAQLREQMRALQRASQQE